MTSEFSLDTSGRIAGHHGGLAVWYEFEDLSLFAQGYVEAALSTLTQGDEEDGLYWVARFSDLAPATHAAMLKDCNEWAGEIAQQTYSAETEGRRFYERRSQGHYMNLGLRPLTLFIGDDGRVYQKVST